MTRLNRVLEKNKEEIELEQFRLDKVIREVKKVYAFCVDGSFETIKLLADLMIPELEKFTEGKLQNSNYLMDLLLLIVYWV